MTRKASTRVSQSTVWWGRAILLAALLILAMNGAVWAEEPLGIAVMKFKDAQLKPWWSWSWEVGEGMTQLVTDALAAKGTLRVLERDRINDLLSEKGLVESGDIDPSSAIELGKLLGVRLMVLGSVTQFDLKSTGGISFGFGTIGGSSAKVVLTGRVVDTQTGEILGSVKGEGSALGGSFSLTSYQGISIHGEEFRNSTLGKAADQAVQNFVDNIEKLLQESSARLAAGGKAVLQGKVVALTANGAIINLGANQGLKKGMKLQIFRLQTVEGLSEPVRVPVGTAKVTSVDPNAAVITLESQEAPVAVGDLVSTQ